MASFEFLAIIMTGLGLTASILYYTTVLKNANKTQQMQLETRQAQLFMQLYDKFSDQEFLKHQLMVEQWEWTDYEDFQEKYGVKKNPEIYIHFGVLARFYEGLGVLVKRKLIDPYLVDDLMSGTILSFWDKFGESFIKVHQVRINYPQFYEQVEYLTSVIKPIVKSQHPGSLYAS